jgi:hypothetical protein
MKRFAFAVLVATLFVGGFTTGCETSHSESDTQGVFGGQKHEETTTTKNPVTGDVSTEHKVQKTNP